MADWIIHGLAHLMIQIGPVACLQPWPRLGLIGFYSHDQTMFPANHPFCLLPVSPGETCQAGGVVVFFRTLHQLLCALGVSCSLLYCPFVAIREGLDNISQITQCLYCVLALLDMNVSRHIWNVFPSTGHCCQIINKGDSLSWQPSVGFVGVLYSSVVKW